jgi:hypothetical protein
MVVVDSAVQWQRCASCKCEMRLMLQLRMDL